MLGRGLAEFGGAVLDLGQHGPWDPEEHEKVVVPRARMNIEQERPRGVGGVGDVNLAVRQAPNEKAVDRAEGQVSAFRFSASAGNIVEDPRDLCRREIGIEQQAGPGGHEVLASAILEFGAKAAPCGDLARRLHCGSDARSSGSRPMSFRAGSLCRSPASALGSTPALNRASRAVESVVRHRDSGSCSTQPP